MNLLVSSVDLVKALNLVQNTVERKTTMPILSNVLLSAEDGILKLAGSNMDVSVLSTTSSKVKERGSITVNGKMLVDIVRELPEGDVTISVSDGDRVEIVTQKSKFKIIGVNAQEYPSLPGLSIEPKGSIAAKQLLEMINKTIYATSADETRFNLSGVCFESVSPEGTKILRNKKSSAQNLRLVATDGHRLSLITRPIENFNFQGRVIAPKRGLNELKKVLEEAGDKDVKIEISEGFLIVESAGSKLAMRLIDGEFPDYAKALPDKEGTKIVLSAEDLSHALKRVAILVSDKQKCVKFELKKNLLRISSSSPELGEAIEDLEVSYTGSEITVGFNARYVLDITGAVGESRLELEFHGDTGPGKLSAEGDESSINIVMPMRIV